jgi:citrate lyase beta subunit
MRHYKHLTDEHIDHLFYIKPQEFDKNSDINILKYALGATLYMPATKENIHEMLLKTKYPALTTVVICLEDAISIEQTSSAIQNLNNLFLKLYGAANENSLVSQKLPLIFIRIREYSQLELLLKNPFLRQFACGFILPKYEAETGIKCLALIDETNKKFASKLYALPLIESSKVINIQTRLNELVLIKASIDEYKHLILNIRIGGTDFSGLYGLRRSIDFSIYDILVVSNCISDIINVFTFDDDYIISGPVWEHFSSIADTQNIINNMKKNNCVSLDNPLINTKAVDGLLKELCLDKANGLIGKTIIHPSQITFANAMQAVTYEEYIDSRNILSSNSGGALKSDYNNKMNEVSPHLKWAQKIMKRTAVYGVLNPNESYTNLF